VTWNIEKGKRWELLEVCLNSDPLRTADVLCLNEVDDGMARSGNRRIAHEIADRLGMTAIFGPAFRELTKGTGDEIRVPGENTTAVQGNAVLTRLPVMDHRNLKLPDCRNYLSGEEKRLGGRHALIVRLDCGSGRILTVANTHLEVLTTSRCRARQMGFLLQNLGSGPAIVTGDLNTNTFDRGSFWATLRSLVRLMRNETEQEVLKAWKYEPVFAELRNAGFSWDGFNDELPTCSADLSSLEDQKYVPAVVRRYILSRVRHLPLRLDWIAARGVEPRSTGRTITDLPCQPSDHLPITCDLVLRG
jgi:endonuclease/exonuclease/phosphatase family metal-dependent hydrolase